MGGSSVCFYTCILTGDFGTHLQHHDTGASTGVEKGGCQCKYLLVSGPGREEERRGEGRGEGRGGGEGERGWRGKSWGQVVGEEDGEKDTRYFFSISPSNKINYPPDVHLGSIKSGLGQASSQTKMGFLN